MTKAIMAECLKEAIGIWCREPDTQYLPATSHGDAEAVAILAGHLYDERCRHLDVKGVSEDVYPLHNPSGKPRIFYDGIEQDVGPRTDKVRKDFTHRVLENRWQCVRCGELVRQADLYDHADAHGMQTLKTWDRVVGVSPDMEAHW